jgi:hypothetical protein
MILTTLVAPSWHCVSSGATGYLGATSPSFDGESGRVRRRGNAGDVVLISESVKVEATGKG